MHIMHAFQTLFLAQDELYNTLHCLWDFHYFLQCVIKQFSKCYTSSAYPDEEKVILREILSFCQQIRFCL